MAHTTTFYTIYVRNRQPLCFYLSLAVIKPASYGNHGRGADRVCWVRLGFCCGSAFGFSTRNRSDRRHIFSLFVCSFVLLMKVKAKQSWTRATHDTPQSAPTEDKRLSVLLAIFVLCVCFSSSFLQYLPTRLNRLEWAGRSKANTSIQHCDSRFVDVRFICWHEKLATMAVRVQWETSKELGIHHPRN